MDTYMYWNQIDITKISKLDLERTYGYILTPTDFHLPILQKVHDVQ